MLDQPRDRHRTQPVARPRGATPFPGHPARTRAPRAAPLLHHLRADLDRLEADVAPSWDAVVEPITRITDRLSLPWGTVGHLMAVRNSDALRAAHATMQPEVVAFSIRLGQSQPIYQALKALQHRGRLGHARRDASAASSSRWCATRSSAASGSRATRRCASTRSRPSSPSCSTRFSNNVLDATKAWALTLRALEEVAGSAAEPARAGGAGRAAGGRASPRREPAPGASRSTRRASCRSCSTAGGATCASSSTAPS